MNNNQKGFTFLELLLVIGITTIMAGVVMPLYNKLFESSALFDATAQIKSEIKLAQEAARSGLGQSAHGVYFDPGQTPPRLVSYEGESYLSRNSEKDLEINMVAGIAFNTDIPNNDLNFQPGTGNTVADAAIEVSYSSSEVKTINILKNGVIID